MNDPTLTLMQWLSPAFPVGAFAYSHGLEQAVADGQVIDAPTLQAWITALVTDGSASADAVLLSCAYGAAAPQDVDATARAFAAGAERLRESDLQGAAFCDTANAVWGIDIKGLAYPVAVGAAARAMDIPLGQTLSLYLHAFASNLIAAAQRLMPLGQTRGQQVLAALGPTITAAADAASTACLQNVTATSFAADIASMRHETLSHRIFRT